MTRLRPICFVFLFYTCFQACNTPTSHSASKGANLKILDTMNALVAQKDFFALDHYFEKYRAEFSSSQELFYRSYLHNAFNRVAASYTSSDSLLRYFYEDLSDSQ